MASSFKKKVTAAGLVGGGIFGAYAANEAGLFESKEDKAAFGAALVAETNAAFSGKHGFNGAHFGDHSTSFGLDHDKASAKAAITDAQTDLLKRADWIPNQSSANDKVGACALALYTLDKVHLKVSEKSVGLYNEGKDQAAEASCKADVAAAVGSGAVKELVYPVNLAN
jgi:hypothetical protein